MQSPGSTLSSGSNPFVGPDMALIRDLNIADRVLVTLSQTSASYSPWKRYFSLVFHEFLLHSHVDGSVDSRLMVNDEEWMIIDATIIRWFYLTISTDLFHTVVADEDDARAVWVKLNGLFTDNKLQRKVLLHGEFYGCHQLDSSIDDYCMRLKKIADELRDLGEPIGDELLITTFTAGLHEDYGNAASNLTLLPDPTFPKVVAYLKLEERRLRMPAPPPPPPAQPANANNRRRGGRQQQQQQPQAQQPPTGGAVRPQQLFQPAPWYAGQNPWTGVVHAYTMPVPRAPAPGVLGPRPPSHQAYFAAPQQYMQPYGPYMLGQPSQPGGLPPLPPMPPAPWDPALLAALHAAPTPTAYAGGGDWHMDTGASAHMAAHPGILHTSRPVTTSTRITVGDGSSLPITHIGHASLPSTSTPLSLSNVLVSSNLIKNLVSVKQFTRDNPVTVEFDLFGFSVKDSRTRMVLLRCDSPGDLYPVHSSPSTSAPVALATGTRRHFFAAGTRLAAHHGRLSDPARWTVQPWTAPWLRRCMRLGTCSDPSWSRPLAALLLAVRLRLRLGVRHAARCAAFGVDCSFGPRRGRGSCRDGADRRPYDAVPDRHPQPESEIL
ncbi:uncharacterized protein [Lolium perenne]|uniref:uncharacterized protein n=1 Tax=Lolium perenne TaxID=4522 RepID=UPI003A99ABC0